jgi:hypothetical protein
MPMSNPMNVRMSKAPARRFVPEVVSWELLVVSDMFGSLTRRGC